MSGTANRADKAEAPQKNKIKYRDVAQMVARLLWEQDVAGSNPVIPTNQKNRPIWSVFWFYWKYKYLNCNHHKKQAPALGFEHDRRRGRMKGMRKGVAVEILRSG